MPPHARQQLFFSIIPGHVGKRGTRDKVVSDGMITKQKASKHNLSNLKPPPDDKKKPSNGGLVSFDRIPLYSN